MKKLSITLLACMLYSCITLAQYYSPTASSGTTIQDATSGNVGIGTASPASNATIEGFGTNPKAVLEVLGRSVISSVGNINTIKENSFWVHNQSSYPSSVGSGGNSGSDGISGVISSDYTILIAKGETQNVGVGKYTPKTRLDVYGFSDAADLFQVANNKMTAIYVTNVGLTGIGTATPAFQLDVNGDIHSSGKVIIGTVSTPNIYDANANIDGYSLYVEGGVMAERYKCALHNGTDWADYVFEKNYKLNPLSEVSDYIKANKHLPDVPSAEDVVCDGVDVVKMDAILLKKIEELTLYVIQLKEEMANIKSQNK